MQVVSVNVGLPREVIWKDMTVRTGVFKDPVDGPVTISKLNLAGDRQADLTPWPPKEQGGGAHRSQLRHGEAMS